MQFQGVCTLCGQAVEDVCVPFVWNGPCVHRLRPTVVVNFRQIRTANSLNLHKPQVFMLVRRSEECFILIIARLAASLISETHFYNSLKQWITKKRRRAGSRLALLLYPFGEQFYCGSTSLASRTTAPSPKR